jgi:hypothetical protein
VSETIHKPLPTAFKAKGFDYEQVRREGDIAMFEQTKPGLRGTWFEVVVVQRHDGYTIAGRYVAPAESMPSTSTWGRLGWTCSDRATAEKRFNALVVAKGGTT